MSETPETDPEESSGPYTCTSCCAGTWNDDDLCDDCVAEARAEQAKAEDHPQ